MPLTKPDKVARDDRVMMIDTKTIDMDRVLINLFMLIQHRGVYPAARSGAVTRTAQGLATWICQDTVHFPGFAGNEEMTRLWLEADLLDLANRGKKNEALVAPRPVHLNAYKMRNAKHCRDYNAAPQLYRLLTDENDTVIARLKDILGAGVDSQTGKYTNTPVDLETLTILRLSDREGQDQPGKERVPPHAPLCTGQGRLLRDDVRRLLRYEEIIPRPIWVDYFKTLCGFHLALYVRRLAAQVGAWMRDKEMAAACLACPIVPTAEEPLHGCPYPLEYIVDMGDQPDTPMAALSQASADEHLRAMDAYVRDSIALTKLIQFVDSAGGAPHEPRAIVREALRVYRENDSDLRGYCRSRLNEIVGAPPDERFARIRDDFRDDPFRAYVECILLERYGWHRTYFRQLFRSLLSPNRDTGMLVSGRTLRSPFRFHLGTRLLETLVQIAVLQPDGSDAQGQPMFRSEPMLIGDLLMWLRRRYGIAIGALQVREGATLAPTELRALRENEERFKDRLREIGFYTDLSDASNAQRVTPRYLVGRG